MSFHPNRKSLVGVKVEAAAGTDPGAFVSGDLNMSIFGEPSVGVDPTMHDIEPLKADFSTDPPIVGTVKGAISWRSILAGTDSSTVTTVPSWAKGMLVCGMQGATLSEISYSGSSGTPVAGETFTQAVTSATAKFMRDDGSSKIYVYSLSGSPDNTNTWTGGDSGATFSPTTDDSDYGYVQFPDSAVDTYKVGLINKYGSGTAGTQRAFLGCRGTWTMNADTVGGPVWLDFAVDGAPYADTQDDVAAVPSPTYQVPTYAGFRGVGFLIGGLTASEISFSSLTIAAGYSTYLPENANNTAYGVDYAIHGGRKFECGFDPLLVESSTINWWDEFRNGTTGTMYFTFGSGAGNIIEVYAPKYTFRGWSGKVRDEHHALDLPFSLHRDGSQTDNELYIVTR